MNLIVGCSEMRGGMDGRRGVKTRKEEGKEDGVKTVFCSPSSSATSSARAHPVLFLGGPFPLSFKHLQSWFASRGYESTACFPCFGQQQPKKSTPEHDVAYELAELVRNSVKSAFPPVLIANGYGCHVASKYLESHPATALVLVSPGWELKGLGKELRRLRDIQPDAVEKVEASSGNLLELVSLLKAPENTLEELPDGAFLPLSDFTQPPPNLTDPASIYKIESASSSRMPMLVVEFANNSDPDVRRVSDEEVAMARLDCDYLEVDNGEGGMFWHFDAETVDAVGEAVVDWLDGIGL